MPKSRREIRESAFILLFEKQFRDDSIDEIIEIAKCVNELTINSDVEKIVKLVLEKSDELDQIITKYSDKRTIDRIPKINLSILRLSICEDLYDDRVPTNVAINEAVLIAKKFAQKPDVSFVNGVLGAYAKDKKGTQDA